MKCRRRGPCRCRCLNWPIRATVHPLLARRSMLTTGLRVGDEHIECPQLVQSVLHSSAHICFKLPRGRTHFSHHVSSGCGRRRLRRAARRGPHRADVPFAARERARRVRSRSQRSARRAAWPESTPATRSDPALHSVSRRLATSHRYLAVLVRRSLAQIRAVQHGAQGVGLHLAEPLDGSAHQALVHRRARHDKDQAVDEFGQNLRI